jgi:hypothetical protein
MNEDMLSYRDPVSPGSPGSPFSPLDPGFPGFPDGPGSPASPLGQYSFVAEQNSWMASNCKEDIYPKDI